MGLAFFFSFQAVHFPDRSFEFEVLPILSKHLIIIIISNFLSPPTAAQSPWLQKKKIKFSPNLSKPNLKLLSKFSPKRASSGISLKMPSWAKIWKGVLSLVLRDLERI